MTLKSAIMVFAKAPIAGLVKTRLIPTIGWQKATQLHCAMATHSVHVATACGIEHSHVQLWCTPDIHDKLFGDLKRDYAVSLHQQVGDDLGERMYHAFQNALVDHDRVIIVGSDCPVISKKLIEHALFSLENNEAVLVPAEDGGYVLLGLRKAVKELFDGIAWGTSGVFTQTLERLLQAGFTWEEFPAQWDVDRPDDLLRLCRVSRDYELHVKLRSVIASLSLDMEVDGTVRAANRT